MDMEMEIIEVELPAPPRETAIVAIETLIGDLLGVDAADLAPMARTGDQMNGAALYGLQAFMRRVLELVIQLRDMPHVTIHLKSETNARDVHSWPNARIANIAMLFVWSMLWDDRWARLLPFARLEAAADVEVDPPVAIEQRLRDMPIDELVAMYREWPESRASGDDLPAETFPISVGELVRSHLGIEPLTLTRGVRATEAEVEKLYAGEPELRSLAGISRLLSSAIGEYKVMLKRDTCQVRLKSDADAELAERPSTRVASLITLLAAALHADDRHNVVFLPPRTRTASDEANLRALAKTVYLDYSDEALSGLELICDGNVHFGWGITPDSLAVRLLMDVARECPHAPMPFVVQLGHWVNDVVAEIGGSGPQHDPALGALQ